MEKEDYDKKPEEERWQYLERLRMRYRLEKTLPCVIDAIEEDEAWGNLTPAEALLEKIRAVVDAWNERDA